MTLQVKTTCLSRFFGSDCDDTDKHELFMYYLSKSQENYSELLDKTKWQISSKDKNESKVVVFVILLELVVCDQIIGVYFSKIVYDTDFYSYLSTFGYDANYNCILGGFKPTELLKANTDIYLKDLFYIGGIKGYLKHL